jgi:cathepsin F
LTGSRCQPREKRQIVGGASPIDDNHEDVQLYLREALVEINKGEGPDYTVKRVYGATTQVVAGSLVKFNADLLFQDNEVTCAFEVWERAWIPDGRQVKVNCNDEKKFEFKQIPLNQRDKNKTRQKRDTLVGGPQEIEKDDKDALELLNNHLSRLDTGNENPLTLVSVEKISRKVVAGLSYEILGNFKAADEEKKCKVTIWHRPWIQTAEGTQIEAKCDDGVRFKQRTKRSLRPLPERLHRHEEGHFEHDSHHASEVKSDVLFKQFQQKYSRHYANELEKNTRLRIFKKNLHKIDMLNRHEQGTAKYGLTQFADMTEKEYLHKTGLLIRGSRDNELRNPIAEIPDVELPDEFDWVEKGAVTSVKNQGQCGSCWSFSVTGNIEGLHAVKTGKLESYSEQELLDCDTTDNACNGGYMDDAFKAIEKIGGLELEDDYPYQAKKNKKCMFNSAKVHVKVKGAVDIPKGDEVAMQKYLVANGPISIGINAAAMQFYKGGVSHPWKILCRKADLDHGVLLVGYGTKSYPLFNKTLPYWKIKNSWGKKNLIFKKIYNLFLTLNILILFVKKKL